MSQPRTTRLNEVLALLFVGFFAALAADLFFVDNVHPYVEMGICALFIILSLIAVVLSIMEMSKKMLSVSAGVLFIGFAIIVSAISIIYLRSPLRYLEYQPVARNFQSLCSGQPSLKPDTLEQKKYQSFIAIDTPDMQGKWMMHPLDLGWTPKNPEDVELVGCFQESQILIETCNYTGAVVERRKNLVWVTLLDAKTGAVVGGQVFEGSEPGKCLSAVSGSGEIVGSKVMWPEIENWLQSYVSPAVK